MIWKGFSKNKKAKSFEDVFADIGGAPAITAGYVRGGGTPVVLTKGRCYRDGPSVSEDACWHIGSVAKTMTAALVMRLGLDLDAPLQVLAPDLASEMHPDWHKITLRGLLSHRAGLAANVSRKRAFDDTGEAPEARRRSILAAHWCQPLPGKPGRFRYSNLGYTLAGHLAETGQQMPFETLLQTHIAEPLGLSSLDLGAPARQGDPWGHSGFFRPKAVSPDLPQADNPRWMAPAGTYHITLRELLVWGQANMQACHGRCDDFLTQAQYQAMHVSKPGTYGVGWEVAVFKRRDGKVSKIQGHSGSNTMWITQLYFDPDTELVMALSMNRPRLLLSQKHLVDLARTLI